MLVMFLVEARKAFYQMASVITQELMKSAEHNLDLRARHGVFM